MKLIPGFLSIIFVIFFISNNILSQPKEKFVLRQNFVPLIDSLITPPSNCEEAFSYMIYDSANGELDYMELLTEQDKVIQNIFREISSHLNESKPKMPPPDDGNAPPGGMPPGGMEPRGLDDKTVEIMEDISDANIAADKLTVDKEKFKNELTDMQDKVNDNLHKTIATDYDAHILIINDFLKNGLVLYKKYFRSFRESMLKLDELLEKYDYGSKIKFRPLKSDVYELQMLQVTILKFLITVTKEFVNIGTKFYNEKYNH